ncbi:hypothetical protein diail_6534 [Diaporthe ilicicola]|nr:hypothetical protein diail_6534 [Diaporthe ilicicola]
MLGRTFQSAATRGLRYASTSRKSAAAADPNSPSRQNVRRVVLTGAVALITAVGAITGARLKNDKDAVKQREKVQEMPIADRIAIIDARRAELLRTKESVERKLERLEARMRGDAAAVEERSQQRD